MRLMRSGFFLLLIGTCKWTAVYSKPALTFEQNQGQTDARVKFLLRDHGHTLFLTSTEAVLSTDHGVFRMKLSGANPVSKAEGLDQQATISNYFIGNDPAKWRTDVPNYGRVRFAEVYPGIDLVYYGKDQQLEYDWIVKPGADPSEIRLKFAGVKRMRVDRHGDLVLETAAGEIRQKKPVVYQEKEIAGRYAISARREEASFEVGPYDASKPLVIDPVLVYSSYLGGNGGDQGNAISVDSAGQAYVTGTTGSSNFPIAPGSQSRGSATAFLSKISADGKSLIFSTYLGGTGSATGAGFAMDPAGNVFITGSTVATDFPVVNAYQPHVTKASGFSISAFVTKLNPDGSKVLFSTYLAGSKDDQTYAIASDAAGSAYVTGLAGSSDFPTVNPIQAVPGGLGDTFITKFSPNGSTLQYSTYLGGDGADIGRAIAVDSSGNAYVTGTTVSTNFPSVNAFQTNHVLSSSAFVAKVNPAGSAFIYSSNLGGISGSGSTAGFAIVADFSGNAFVTGADNTGGGLPGQIGLARGGTDAFVTKIGPAGSTVRSVFLGGTSTDKCFAIALNNQGQPWLTGITTSLDFPTVNPLMAAKSSFATQVFVSRLSSDLSTLLFSTTISGVSSGDDEGHAIAVDGNGDAYVTGFTDGADFPTLNAFQNVRGGPAFGFDAFVLKISPGPDIPVIAANGIVNGASFQPGIVPNSWATIQGAYLASVTDDWSKSIVNGQLPTTLDGVTVTVGGKKAYAYYISSGQINFVVPDVGFGPQQVVVTNSLGTSSTFTVTSSQFGPAFFTWPGSQAVATRQDFSWAVKNGTFAGTTTVSAKPGDVIILWGTGFGPTSPVTPVGAQVPADRTYSTLTVPRVTINSLQATVYGAALAPGYAGLYQVAIQVPASLVDGDYPVVANIGGVQSPSGVTLSVRR